MFAGTLSSHSIVEEMIVHFRFFFELWDEKYPTLLLLEFHYDEDIDWYEIKTYRGEEVIGYINGYANHGWAPQANNLWVSEKYRRKGVASKMMSKVEEYFGQAPLPATPIADSDEARGFWSNYTENYLPSAARDEQSKGS
jgi:ribosomal protein S18 acetylase RimI-like enzyme